jgi:hypothetical protein
LPGPGVVVEVVVEVVDDGVAAAPSPSAFA